METVVSNLDMVKSHHADPVWIKNNAAEIYDLLAKSIKRETEPGDATQSLLLMYPFALTNGEVKRWSKLLQDALATRNHYDLEKASERTIDPVGQQYMLSESKEEIEEEFKAAMRRARKRLKPALILEAYIDLFKSQIYHRKNDFNQDMVRSAIKMARQVNLPDCYGELYLALSFAYTSTGDYEKALKYGRMAYNHWVSSPNTMNAARSAFIMGTVYRNLGSEYDLADASEWLTRAEAVAPKSEAAFQIVVNGERGNILIGLGDFPQAVKSLSRALRLSEKSKDDLRTAVAKHALGIALTHNGDLEAAHEYLHESLAYWEEVDSQAQIGHLHHSLGYLEIKRGNPGEAQTLLLRGKDILESLSNHSQYDDRVIQQINNSLDKLR